MPLAVCCRKVHIYPCNLRLWRAKTVNLVIRFLTSIFCGKRTLLRKLFLGNIRLDNLLGDDRNFPRKPIIRRLQERLNILS